MRLILLSFLVLFFACQSDPTADRIYPEDSSQYSLLQSIPKSESGLHFSNNVSENLAINTMTFDGMLQGAGVGILDVNKDGLPDVYLTSNMEKDKLFLNEGDFKFKNITNKAGIRDANWSTGVSIVDINADGYDDIYVCKFLYDDVNKRANLFYLNNQDGTFTEQAAQMGIADKGYSIMANFLDYDHDGDLDLYVVNQPPNSLDEKRRLKNKQDFQYTDRLYKNTNGKFQDVTQQAGITNYSYSLSATAFDFNQDGWTDIYVASDYDEPDFFYKNNQDGTFSNVAETALKHISNFSMGVDVADINNDGLQDVYVADMVAEDNFRQKTNMSGMDPKKFFALANNGYHYQYMFNTLQLNNGDESFSEMAQLAGLSNTDWSWSPLFIDLDQDGYKDLLITNGVLKELRNKDFEIWRKDFLAAKMEEARKTSTKSLAVNPLDIVSKAPSFKVSNYVYRNQGDLTFQKMNKEWGFELPTWSQGSAYADFDQDGDLDLLINNMNMDCGLYRNMSNENKLNNYLNIRLKGYAQNSNGVNATIKLHYGDQIQVGTHTACRGYMSSSELVSHFGLGDASVVDKIEVIWPDRKISTLTAVNPNQAIVIDHASADGNYSFNQGPKKIFTNQSPIELRHEENNFDDYEREILLPYRPSTLGPTVAVADINKDGKDDLYVGGSAGLAPQLLLSRGNSYTPSSQSAFNSDKACEDGGAAFLDFDQDGDLDLYVSSGGNEYSKGGSQYQDRLYVNDGSGNFTKSNNLPNIKVSSSVVLPFDFDADGDMDLFVGGRQVPGQYGKNTDSYILINEGNKFDLYLEGRDILEKMGMVTDAKLIDVDEDGKNELLVVGEWMPIKLLDYSNGLKDVSSSYGFENSNGWWNRADVADVNGDGKMDIIAGNLGKNIKYKASEKEPFKLFVDDFDANGSNDVYLGYYEDGNCYPVRGRQCSSEQMPFIKKKFESYEAFGKATVEKVLEGKIGDETQVQEAKTFASTIFLNQGGGKFKTVELPNEVQMSPVYGIAVDDFDKDGKQDIFLAGNMYQREVETTRSDAGKGWMLSFDEGDALFSKRTTVTGISADKDVRDVVKVKSGNSNYLLIVNNDDQMDWYKY